MMANGEEGNDADSLAVATHLGLHAFIVGPDAGVEREAIRWLALAAQQGHQDAARMLAHRYAHGSTT